MDPELRRQRNIWENNLHSDSGPLDPVQLEHKSLLPFSGRVNTLGSEDFWDKISGPHPFKVPQGGFDVGTVPKIEYRTESEHVLYKEYVTFWHFHGEQHIIKMSRKRVPTFLDAMVMFTDEMLRFGHCDLKHAPLSVKYHGNYVPFDMPMDKFPNFRDSAPHFTVSLPNPTTYLGVVYPNFYSDHFTAPDLIEAGLYPTERNDAVNNTAFQFGTLRKLIKDNVSCLKCGCHISNFVKGDIPLEEHLCHAEGRCTFLESLFGGYENTVDAKINTMFRKIPDPKMLLMENRLNTFVGITAENKLLLVKHGFRSGNGLGLLNKGTDVQCAACGTQIPIKTALKGSHRKICQQVIEAHVRKITNGITCLTPADVLKCHQYPTYKRKLGEFGGGFGLAFSGGLEIDHH